MKKRYTTAADTLELSNDTGRILENTKYLDDVYHKISERAWSGYKTIHRTDLFNTGWYSFEVLQGIIAHLESNGYTVTDKTVSWGVVSETG